MNQIAFKTILPIEDLRETMNKASKDFLGHFKKDWAVRNWDKKLKTEDHLITTNKIVLRLFLKIIIKGKIEREQVLSNVKKKMI